MSITARFGFPEYGGSVTDEQLVLEFILELGLAGRFRRPSGQASFEAIVDETTPGYFVTAMSFYGFASASENGHALFIMSKSYFSRLDVVSKIRELAVQMDGSLIHFQPIFLTPEKN